MAWLRKHEGSTLAVAGLIVAAVLFLAVNVFANAAFRGAQLDLTGNKLYTLADGTRRTLDSIGEPIDLKLYFSPALRDAAPRYGAYYDRVRELLQRYRDLSGGKVRLHLLNPEPFSDAEDRAVAEGLQGVPVSSAGDVGYFGLVGTNATDGRASIAFFNLEREPFVEYDLTKLVYGLAHPDLPVLGVLSGIPLNPQQFGMPGSSEPPPMLFDQLREFYTIEDLEPNLAAIPERLRLLMVIQPSQLGEDALRAIDRFVQGGGKALVIVDPLVESAAAALPPDDASARAAAALLRSWGLILLPDKVAGDLDAARRVSAGPRSANVGDYVAWLTLGPSAFDADDPILASVERINLATAGVLEKAPDATTQVTPLISTGPRSMAIDVEKVRPVPDLQGLLRAFQPEGTPIMLAARVSGPAKPAFPAAPEAGSDPSAATAMWPINVIVVADADMIFDRFWVTAADFFGQRVVVPLANNADFIINALETLSGGEALAGLRGRGTSYRPFTLIDEYRRSAEQLYRAKEQELQARLKQLQEQLREAQRGAEAGGAGEILLGPEQKATIERFRGEILAVRRDLRDVQSALRSDIERLEGTVKTINIAAVPIVIGLVAGGIGIGRRLRRRPARPASRSV